MGGMVWVINPKGGNTMSLWNGSYETGNELVDTDHKEIFGLVEQVLSSSYISRKEKVQAAIEFLANYVVKHFANEERLMDESAYPGSEAHKKEHRDFLGVATDLKERFDNDGYALGQDTSEGTVLHLSMEINKTVVSWLTKHVMGSDKALAAHYRKWQNS
jgi:hemerythrin